MEVLQMKLIEHIIFVDIGNNKNLLINSLNGLIDRIDSSIYDTIIKWQNCDEIVPNGEWEVTLYNNLKFRGYLVNSKNEEMARKEEILMALRKQHATTQPNNKHITFVMTYDCNFRCPYCFEGGADKNKLSKNQAVLTCTKKAVMTPTLIDAALDLVGKGLQSVGLFGGEPLLPKNRFALEYLISRAPEKTYNIITNGYYLEEFFDLLSKINISDIMVTLDGEEKTHNRRRYLANGKPTYKKIMAGIKKCLENNIPICIRMNLDASNYAECNELKKKLLEQFAEYKNFLSFEISPMFEASVHEKNKMFFELYKSDVEYTLEEQKQRNRLLSKGSPILNAIMGNGKLRPSYTYCYAHDNGFLVDPYGNIFPCLLAVGKDELAIGKYFPAVEFKQKSIRTRNIDKIPECRECKYSLLCGGGCPVHLSDYNDVYKPVCYSIKNQIHNISPIIYNTKKIDKPEVEISSCNENCNQSKGVGTKCCTP